MPLMALMVQVWVWSNPMCIHCSYSLETNWGERLQNRSEDSLTYCDTFLGQDFIYPLASTNPYSNGQRDEGFQELQILLSDQTMYPVTLIMLG